MIGACCAPQILGRGALAVASGAVRAVVLSADPFGVVGGVRVQAFDQDPAAGGDGNSAVVFQAQIMRRAPEDRLKFGLGGGGARRSGAVNKTFEKLTSLILIGGGAVTKGLVVGYVVSHVPGGRARHVLHSVQGAFAGSPVGVCVVRRVSIFIGDGEVKFLAGTLAGFDGDAQRGVEISESGVGDRIDGSVEVL